MRRKDREKDEIFALEVVRDCEYGTLATVNHDNTPYCIPISPILYNNAIYFHCALKGLKLENIVKNNSVCLSCVRHTKLIPEKFTTEFESAVVMGTCELLSDDNEKIEVLRALCEKYANSNMGEFNNSIEKSLKVTAIGKINIKQITGKAKIY